jgi:hypothetical protein
MDAPDRTVRVMTLRETVLLNARVIVPLAVPQSAVYFTLNHCPPFPTSELPMTWVDQATPFWLWTIWPYLLLLSSDLLLPLFVRDRTIFRRMIVAYIAAMSVTVPFWVFYPTSYPRPPLPDEDSWNVTAYRNMRAVDSSACCIPSGHILVPAVGCWGLIRDRRIRRGWGWAGFLGLSLTILTTKQHYFWDLLGGLVAAAIGIAVSGLVVKDAATAVVPMKEISHE